jgi:copper chaperone
LRNGIPHADASPATNSSEYHQNKQENLMSEFVLHIDGMHCGSCVRRVTQALNATNGVEVEEVRIGAARFKSPDENLPVDTVIAALAKAGFSARLEQ